MLKPLLYRWAFYHRVVQASNPEERHKRKEARKVQPSIYKVQTPFTTSLLSLGPYVVHRATCPYLYHPDVGTGTHRPPLHSSPGMSKLSTKTIEAIIKKWHQNEYDPLVTTFEKWSQSLENFFVAHGIPDAQRVECAVKLTAEVLRIELNKVLETQANNPVGWVQFKIFMTEFDSKLRSIIGTERFVTEILQRAFGRVSAPLLVALWFALMHVPLLDRAPSPRGLPHHRHSGYGRLPDWKPGWPLPW